MRQWLQRFRSDQRGAVLLETTILFPVLMILAFGGIEFGNIFFAHQAITQQVREAARYLARTANPTVTDTAFMVATSKNPDEPCPLGGRSDYCILPWFSGSNMTALLTTIANPEDADGKRLYRGDDDVQVVTVTATVTYPGMDLFPAIGLARTVQFSIAHSERVIGR
jgi:hypothetical protein